MFHYLFIRTIHTQHTHTHPNVVNRIANCVVKSDRILGWIRAQIHTAQRTHIPIQPTYRWYCCCHSWIQWPRPYTTSYSKHFWHFRFTIYGISLVILFVVRAVVCGMWCVIRPRPCAWCKFILNFDAEHRPNLLQYSFAYERNIAYKTHRRDRLLQFPQWNAPI